MNKEKLWDNDDWRQQYNTMHACMHASPSIQIRKYIYNKIDNHFYPINWWVARLNFVTESINQSINQSIRYYYRTTRKKGINNNNNTPKHYITFLFLGKAELQYAVVWSLNSTVRTVLFLLCTCFSYGTRHSISNNSLRDSFLKI